MSPVQSSAVKLAQARSQDPSTLRKQLMSASLEKHSRRTDLTAAITLASIISGLSNDIPNFVGKTSGKNETRGSGGFLRSANATTGRCARAFHCPRLRMYGRTQRQVHGRDGTNGKVNGYHHRPLFLLLPLSSWGSSPTSSPAHHRLLVETVSPSCGVFRHSFGSLGSRHFLMCASLTNTFREGQYRQRPSNIKTVIRRCQTERPCQGLSR